LGDPSDPVEIHASVPEILTLYPDEGYQGDTLRVTVSGEYLLMVADDVDLILGDGVEQTDAEIQDVDVGIFTIVIDETATAGSRDLELVSGPISVSIPDAFAVLDGDDRPAIVDLQPSEIRQGETIAVNITTSIPPESAESPWLQLDFGEGIVVQTISADTEITTITAEITAELTAPLGARNVEVDDGIRIMEGLQMTVIDQQLNPNSTCGCSAPGPMTSHSNKHWIWFGMVGTIWFGRRRLRS